MRGGPPAPPEVAVAPEPAVLQSPPVASPLGSSFKASLVGQLEIRTMALSGGGFSLDMPPSPPEPEEDTYSLPRAPLPAPPLVRAATVPALVPEEPATAGKSSSLARAHTTADLATSGTTKGKGKKHFVQHTMAADEDILSMSRGEIEAATISKELDHNHVDHSMEDPVDIAVLSAADHELAEMRKRAEELDQGVQEEGEGTMVPEDVGRAVDGAVDEEFEQLDHELAVMRKRAEDLSVVEVLDHGAAQEEGEGDAVEAEPEDGDAVEEFEQSVVPRRSVFEQMEDWVEGLVDPGFEDSESGRLSESDQETATQGEEGVVATQEDLAEEEEAVVEDSPRAGDESGGQVMAEEDAPDAEQQPPSNAAGEADPAAAPPPSTAGEAEDSSDDNFLNMFEDGSRVEHGDEEPGERERGDEDDERSDADLRGREQGGEAYEEEVGGIGLSRSMEDDLKQETIVQSTRRSVADVFTGLGGLFGGGEEEDPHEEVVASDVGKTEVDVGIVCLPEMVLTFPAALKRTPGLANGSPSPSPEGWLTALHRPAVFFPHPRVSFEMVVLKMIRVPQFEYFRGGRLGGSSGNT